MDGNKRYNIIYLPVARRDLINIIDYIAFDLEVPDTAIKMLDTIEASIQRLRDNPFRGNVYSSGKFNDVPYRQLFIKNYIVFYLILEDTVEIQRILYNKRDIGKLL